jgi:signal transduction histidine kinase
MPSLKDLWFHGCGQQPSDLIIDDGRQSPTKEDLMPAVTSTLSRSAAACRSQVERAGPVVPEARQPAGRQAQVLGERARMAREIHDILAHTLGRLFVQLEAAEAVLCEGGDAGRGRHLVAEARRLAAEGLEETQQAIAAIRRPVVLPEALAALTTGDGQVTQRVTGTPRQLRPDAGLALYRTAQEALTNARKHAPGAPVTMTLSFEDEAAVLRVSNTGPAGWPGRLPSALAATGGGYGLHGLRERAELLGGTLSAGPAGDGWLVELRVPA